MKNELESKSNGHMGVAGLVLGIIGFVVWGVVVSVLLSFVVITGGF